MFTKVTSSIRMTVEKNIVAFIILIITQNTGANITIYLCFKKIKILLLFSNILVTIIFYVDDNYYKKIDIHESIAWHFLKVIINTHTHFRF